QLADIDFLVLEVPRLDGATDGWSDEPVPLGGGAARRPVRFGRRSRSGLVRGTDFTSPMWLTSRQRGDDAPG
ncbi:hypothetical protein ACWEQU_26650, partial [Streptomyces nodosus]